jgi:radical SAM superfamily enzyme YgiQ (UPF0313 family)
MNHDNRTAIEPSLSISATGVTLEHDELVLRFDAAGRLTTIYDGNHVYHRGVGNTMLEKWWTDAYVDETSVRIRRFRRVSASRRKQLLETAYDRASRCLRPILARREDEFCTAERESMRQVLRQSRKKLEKERRAVRSIYNPIGVLPPDQYKSVVLQAVTGCPYDCSFCTLYRDTDVRVRSIEEFDRHTQAVKSFFGRGLQSRRTVFLGDADPLSAPQDVLIPMLKLVAQEFPLQYENGIYTFLTARTAANTSHEKLNLLAEHGIERVYLGVESGCEDVLEVLRKPQTPDEVVTGVRKVKAAGIDVGVIVLAGVGGHELATSHLARTTELLETIPLDSHDIVYISPLEEDNTADYCEQLHERSLSRMGEWEIAAQAKRLRSRLAEKVPARVARYHVSEFIYF